MRLYLKGADLHLWTHHTLTLPHLSNYSQVCEQSYGCHICGMRNLELSERLLASPLFLSIVSPRWVPGGTVSDGSGSWVLDVCV